MTDAPAIVGRPQMDGVGRIIRSHVDRGRKSKTLIFVDVINGRPLIVSNQRADHRPMCFLLNGLHHHYNLK